MADQHDHTKAEQQKAEHEHDKQAAAAEAKKEDKRPDIQILVKQAFIFMEGDGSEGKRFATNEINSPITAPAWVVNTPTYKNGLADKNIILLPSSSKASSKEDDDEDKGNGKSAQQQDKGQKAGLQK